MRRQHVEKHGGKLKNALCSVGRMGEVDVVVRGRVQGGSQKHRRQNFVELFFETIGGWGQGCIFREFVP